jgi:hypothetical protein
MVVYNSGTNISSCMSDYRRYWDWRLDLLDIYSTQLQVTTSNSDSNRLWIDIVYISLNLLSLLCLHQSSSYSFQRRTFPFFWVPELFLCLSHRNVRLTPTQLLLCQERSLWNDLPVPFFIVVKPVVGPNINTRGSLVIKILCYKPDGCGFEIR